MMASPSSSKQGSIVRLAPVPGLNIRSVIECGMLVGERLGEPACAALLVGCETCFAGRRRQRDSDSMHDIGAPRELVVSAAMTLPRRCRGCGVRDA